MLLLPLVWTGWYCIEGTLDKAASREQGEQCRGSKTPVETRHSAACNVQTSAQERGRHTAACGLPESTGICRSAYLPSLSRLLPLANAAKNQVMVTRTLPSRVSGTFYPLMSQHAVPRLNLSWKITGKIAENFKTLSVHFTFLLSLPLENIEKSGDFPSVFEFLLGGLLFRYKKKPQTRFKLIFDMIHLQGEPQDY